LKTGLHVFDLESKGFGSVENTLESTIDAKFRQYVENQTRQIIQLYPTPRVELRPLPTSYSKGMHEFSFRRRNRVEDPLSGSGGLPVRHRTRSPQACYLIFFVLSVLNLRQMD
jgi:hypothetical protein